MKKTKNNKDFAVLFIDNSKICGTNTTMSQGTDVFDEIATHVQDGTWSVAITNGFGTYSGIYHIVRDRDNILNVHYVIKFKGNGEVAGISIPQPGCCIISGFKPDENLGRTICRIHGEFYQPTKKLKPTCGQLLKGIRKGTYSATRKDRYLFIRKACNPMILVAIVCVSDNTIYYHTENPIAGFVAEPTISEKDVKKLRQEIQAWQSAQKRNKIKG